MKWLYSILYQHSILLLWKALKKWRANDTNTQLIIWHIISILPFFFCMSGLAEQSACDSTWMLFDWSCTGSTEWLIQLFCDYGAQLGRAWVQSSSDVTEANTLHDMYMKPPLDDKCAAQEPKLKWMVANLQWFRAVFSSLFVLCVIFHWFRFVPSTLVCYLLLLYYTIRC